jgi:hypothetical protein
LDNIDSSSLQDKITPAIRRKVIKEAFSEQKDIEETVKIPNNIEKLLQADEIRENVIKLYYNNLRFVDQLIQDLKSTPIDLLIEKIDTISSELMNLNADFKLKMDSLISFNIIRKESENNAKKRSRNSQ